MNNKISKVLTIVAVVIALIAAFFYISIVYYGDDALKEGPDALELQNAIISPFITTTVIILGATIFFALVTSIFNLIKKPEALKKTLLSIGILGVVLVIAWLLKDGSPVLDAQGNVLDGGEQGSTSNVWSSTGIWFSVILGGVGLALFLVDMVKSLVKS
jgi:hypothetical protein